MGFFETICLICLGLKGVAGLDGDSTHQVEDEDDSDTRNHEVEEVEECDDDLEQILDPTRLQSHDSSALSAQHNFSRPGHGGHENRIGRHLQQIWSHIDNSYMKPMFGGPSPVKSSTS